MTAVVRRWTGRAAVALAAIAAVVAGWSAVDRSVTIWREASLYRREPFSAAQDRLLGRAYMESIRGLRAHVPSQSTLYLIDAVPRPSGAPYFALHYLAPRRVVLLGTARSERPRLIRSRLPKSAEWVVVVDAAGAPLRLFDADHFRPRSERRGR